MSDVHIRTEGQAGRITLTRPKALNALTHDMCLAIEAALTAWRDDPAVALVVVDSEGDRAFCAGGDIQALYQQGRAGEIEPGRRFWRDEYRLNLAISRYPKPYVALMKGVVMGGGVGLSAHGSHRIVSETSMIAMPETAIGFLPDVGGTWILGRSPGHAGEYLGLTGARMSAADAIHAGFADALVPADSLPALTAALAEQGISALADFTADPGPSALAAEAEAIDGAFSASSVAEIRARLDETEWAAKTAAALDRNTPFAMVCALEAIRAARVSSGLAECLNREYRFAYRALEQSDFLEGVRAMVIDKDRSPNWAHASPEAVSSEEVAAMLAPLGAQELGLSEA